MDSDYKTDLASLVEQIRPAHLLCLGPEGKLFAPYCATHVQTQLTVLETPVPLFRALASARFDFVYLSATLEKLSHREGERLLARLRDLHTPRFALLLPLTPNPDDASHWQEQELFAFGLTRLGLYGAGERRLGLYGYDLDHYKTTPDWLNPRFWANPERWDKAWW